MHKKTYQQLRAFCAQILTDRRKEPTRRPFLVTAEFFAAIAKFGDLFAYQGVEYIFHDCQQATFPNRPDLPRTFEVKTYGLDPSRHIEIHDSCDVSLLALVPDHVFPPVNELLKFAKLAVGVCESYYPDAPWFQAGIAAIAKAEKEAAK